MKKIPAYRAFTLIELLVVILIIGLLAAVAAPLYRKYIIRARVSSAYTIIMGLVNDLTQNYQGANSYPTTLTVNGVTIPASPSNNTTWVEVDMGNVVGLAWGSRANSTIVFVTAALSGLQGIPNYVAPTSGTLSGNYNSIGVVSYTDSAGVIRTSCGMWGTGGGYVPFDYQPSACQCNAIANLYYGTITPGQQAGCLS